jgi:hypothetical protein
MSFLISGDFVPLSLGFVKGSSLFLVDLVYFKASKNENQL